MECLKQLSPKARKRSGPQDIENVNEIGSSNHSSIHAEFHSKRPRVVN